jgi:hypothetical protein
MMRKWKVHPLEPHGNNQPAPPSPGGRHFIEEDSVHLAILEAAFVSARTAPAFFATKPFQVVMAEQATHIDALGAYLVSGSYALVRDGLPIAVGVLQAAGRTHR